MRNADHPADGSFRVQRLREPACRTLLAVAFGSIIADCATSPPPREARPPAPASPLHHRSAQRPTARHHSVPEPTPGLDVGRPLTIVRPPIGRDRAPAIDGTEEYVPCSTPEGEPGLWVATTDPAPFCECLDDLCGGPGRLRDDWPLDPEDPALGEDAPGPPSTRAEVDLGDPCRGPAPGYTWQCNDDGTGLACTAPTSQHFANTGESDTGTNSPNGRQERP